VRYFTVSRLKGRRHECRVESERAGKLRGGRPPGPATLPFLLRTWRIGHPASLSLGTGKRPGEPGSGPQTDPRNTITRAHKTDL